MHFESYIRIIENIPESYKNLDTPAKIYLSFLAEIPTRENILQLHSLSNEDENYEVGEGVVYVWCMKDGRKLNFSNKLVENILKMGATTRNLNTV